MDEELIKTAAAYDQLGRDLYKAAMDGDADADTEYGVGAKLQGLKGGFMELIRKLKGKLKKKLSQYAAEPAKQRSKK